MTQAGVRERERDGNRMLMALKKEGSHEPGNGGTFQRLEKARKGIVPWNIQEEHSSDDPFWTSDF